MNQIGAGQATDLISNARQRGFVPSTSVAVPDVEPQACPQRCLAGNNSEVPMPVFILWAGIPLIILGGGFFVYRIVGG
jgi:hypothetical protein